MSGYDPNSIGFNPDLASILQQAGVLPQAAGPAIPGGPLASVLQSQAAAPPPTPQSQIPGLEQQAFAPNPPPPPPVKADLATRLGLGLANALSAYGAGRTGQRPVDYLTQYKDDLQRQQNYVYAQQLADADRKRAMAKYNLDIARAQQLGDEKDAAQAKRDAAIQLEKDMREIEARALKAHVNVQGMSKQAAEAAVNAGEEKQQSAEDDLKDYRRFSYEIASMGGKAPDWSPGQPLDRGALNAALSAAAQRKQSVEHPAEEKVTQRDREDLSKQVELLTQTVNGTGKGDSLQELLDSGKVTPEYVDQLVQRHLRYSSLPLPLQKKFAAAADEIVGPVLHSHQMSEQLAAGSPQQGPPPENQPYAEGFKGPIKDVVKGIMEGTTQGEAVTKAKRSRPAVTR